VGGFKKPRLSLFSHGHAAQDQGRSENVAEQLQRFQIMDERESYFKMLTRK